MDRIGNEGQDEDGDDHAGEDELPSGWRKPSFDLYSRNRISAARTSQVT